MFPFLFSLIIRIIPYLVIDFSDLLLFCFVFKLCQRAGVNTCYQTSEYNFYFSLYISNWSPVDIKGDKLQAWNRHFICLYLVHLLCDVETTTPICIVDREAPSADDTVTLKYIYLNQES